MAGSTIIEDKNISAKMDVRRQLRDERFVQVRAEDYGYDLRSDVVDQLKQSWDRLGRDPFFGGEDAAVRTRRYSDFGYDPAQRMLTRLSHVPYYQSPEMNQFVGGEERHFDDVEDQTVDNDFLQYLTALVFESLPIEEKYLDRPWVCQIHQIRIDVAPEQTYEVVPEGIHSDGYPWAGLFLVGRDGVTGAENLLLDWDEKVELLRGTLLDPFDALIFEDKHMKHYSSPMTASSNGGRRDILAISFSLPGTEHETLR